MQAASYVGPTARYKLIVLPWVLFILFSVVYLLVITIGLLSQVLVASLYAHPSQTLAQGEMYQGLDLTKQYFVEVGVHITVATGSLVLGLKDAGSGVIWMNRTLEIDPRTNQADVSVLLPLTTPSCAFLQQPRDFLVYVMEVGSPPHKESYCTERNLFEVVLPIGDISKITIYSDITSIEALFYNNAAQWMFVLGAILTALLYIFLCWTKRTFRWTLVIYTVFLMILILCISYTFTTSDKSPLNMVCIVFVYILSVVPIFHLLVLFCIAHRALRGDTSDGQSIFSVVRRGRPRVAPIPLQKMSSVRTDYCQYYCPICMLFHDIMFKTTCCSQYICRSCISDYLLVKTAITTQSQTKLSSFIDCPYCATSGVNFVLVPPGETVRSYEDSPTPTARPSANSTPRSTGEGDPFEKLKAKMVPFGPPLPRIPTSPPTAGGSNKWPDDTLYRRDTGSSLESGTFAPFLPGSPSHVLAPLNSSSPPRIGSSSRNTSIPRLLQHALQNSLFSSSGGIARNGSGSGPSGSGPSAMSLPLAPTGSNSHHNVLAVSALSSSSNSFIANSSNSFIANSSNTSSFAMQNDNNSSSGDHANNINNNSPDTGNDNTNNNNNSHTSNNNNNNQIESSAKRKASKSIPLDPSNLLTRAHSSNDPNVNDDLLTTTTITTTVTTTTMKHLSSSGGAPPRPLSSSIERREVRAIVEIQQNENGGNVNVHHEVASQETTILRRSSLLPPIHGPLPPLPPPSDDEV